MRVLVVHDTRAMRTIVTRTLRRLESVDEVIQSSCAEEAVELLGEFDVDLVLCDWNLSGMGGIELLEALRAAGWTLPFGFITAETAEEVLNMARERGAAFVVAKPFSEADLQSAIDRLEKARDLDALLYGDGDANGAGWSGAELHAVTDEVWEPEAPGRPEVLSDLLSRLCETRVSVSPVREGPSIREPRYVATYLDETGAPCSLLVFSTPVALASAASMTRWSPLVVRAWVRSGILPEELLGDLGEVANVLRRFVNPSGRPVVLSEIAGFAPSEQAGALRGRTPRALEHYEIDFSEYCKGRVTVVSL